MKGNEAFLSLSLSPLPKYIWSQFKYNCICIGFFYMNVLISLFVSRQVYNNRGQCRNALKLSVCSLDGIGKALLATRLISRSFTFSHYWQLLIHTLGDSVKICVLVKVLKENDSFIHYWWNVKFKNFLPLSKT